MLAYILRKIRDLSLRPDVDYKTHKKTTHSKLLTQDACRLPTPGSGCLYLQLQQPQGFNLDLIARNAIIRITVSQRIAKLYCIYKGRLILLSESEVTQATPEHHKRPEYWVTFDALARRIQFGKLKDGERIAHLDFALPPSNKPRTQFWMNGITHYRIDAAANVFHR